MDSLLLFGAAGGMIRGLVGYTKYQFSFKNITFNPWYFAIIVGLSSIVGISVTWAIDNSGMVIAGVEVLNPALAFIIGYAGGDFLEYIYKFLAQKPTLSTLLDILKSKK